MNACHSDACDCGRKPCPTPEACRLPEADFDAHAAAMFWRCYLAVIALAAAGAMFWPY